LLESKEKESLYLRSMNEQFFRRTAETTLRRR
jgi:hypothetical protein